MTKTGNFDAFFREKYLTKNKVMCLEELEAELLAYGISSRTGRDARKQLENRLSYDWCQGRKTVALITE